MGFLKGLGEGAGLVAGLYFGGLIELAGSIVGSDSLEKLGENVFDVSCRAGEALGDVAENIADTAVSVSKNAIETYSSRQTSVSQTSVTQDSQKIKNALDAFDE